MMDRLNAARRVGMRAGVEQHLEPARVALRAANIALEKAEMNATRRYHAQGVPYVAESKKHSATP